MRAAIPILCLFLNACGRPEMVSWEPASARMNDSQIAQRAIQIGQDDIDTIREAGGLPLATMTFRGADMSEIVDAAADRVAQYGGTHFMVGKWSSETHFDVWSVDASTTTREVRFVVIRVPASGWSNLPKALRPNAARR